MSAMSPAFDKNASKSERAIKLADMMALAQAKSNTNIEQLGEAITNGGGALANANLPLEQIIASMGKLADAGLKSSQGGTLLGAMFSKLVKPSGMALKEMAKLGVNLKNLPLNDMPKLIGVLGTALDKETNPTKKLALSFELFGKTGVKAFSALKNSGPKSLRELSNELKGAKNSASDMAKIKLDNFSGQITSLKSATEGFLIELGDMFTKGDKTGLPFLKSMVNLMGDIAKAFQFANGNMNSFGTKFQNLTDKQKFLVTFASDFKAGVLEFFAEFKNIFSKVLTFVSPLTSMFSQTEGGIGKMVAKFMLLATVLAPVFAGIVAFGLVLGPIITIGTSLISIISGITAAVGVLGSVFLLNPIGLGITAIVAGVAVAWNTFEGFRNFVKGIFQWFFEKFDTLNSIVPDFIKEKLGINQDVKVTKRIKGTKNNKGTNN